MVRAVRSDANHGVGRLRRRDRVAALTLGVVYDIADGAAGRIGLGGDATLYHLSADIVPYWEGSHSYHVFLRWRPNGRAHHHHH